MGKARGRNRGRIAAGLLIIIAVVVIAAFWFFALHTGSWKHFRTDLFTSHGSGATTAGLMPCGAPLPKLSGGAVAASRAAKFATIEQVEKLKAGARQPVFRVQARLLGLSTDGHQIHLRFGSLTHPNMTLDAYIPASGCGASQEDTALYEELREVVGLRFGPMHAQLRPPSEPTQVVATGVVVPGPHGWEMRPLLDLHVQ
ncbi:MAG: hypothetical protein ACRD1Y_11940 [Terriglobales bacterium]